MSAHLYDYRQDAWDIIGSVGTTVSVFRNTLIGKFGKPSSEMDIAHDPQMLIMLLISWFGFSIIPDNVIPKAAAYPTSRASEFTIRTCSLLPWSGVRPDGFFQITLFRILTSGATIRMPFNQHISRNTCPPVEEGFSSIPHNVFPNYSPHHRHLVPLGWC